MTHVVCKLEVYVPKDYVKKLMEALGEIGVGKVGDYNHCFSLTEVVGYWRPLPGASPFEGKVGDLLSEPEIKLEARCDFGLVGLAVKNNSESPSL